MPALSTPLRDDLHRAGYYPDLVGEVLEVALADEDVEAHLVHPETTFDGAEVRRHVTVLALTATRLVVAHVDDVDAKVELNGQAQRVEPAPQVGRRPGDRELVSGRHAAGLK